VPLWVVGDRGYSSDAFRDLVWGKGARPAIPTRSNEAAVACPDYIYNNRSLVERLWGRLKEWRAVATRYEKTAVYRPRLVGHRIEAYAARTAGESCSSLIAAGDLKPCRSISQVAL
jgi:transposase